jgi:anti-sigma factor RsiW
MSDLDCIDPQQIKEGDLVAYLHGDASSQVAEHIARCAACAEQVEQLRVVDARLLDAFYRHTCPTPGVLADFVFEQLPAVERLRVGAHVRACELCAREVSSVRDLADEPPPSLLTRLREALALALVARPKLPAPASVRGMEQQGRSEIDGWIVTFSIHAGSLTGRVRKRPPDVTTISGQAWLLKGDVEQEAEIPYSDVDEKGRFHFAALVPGTYDLLLQLGERDVALEDVRVE